MLHFDSSGWRLIDIGQLSINHSIVYWNGQFARRVFGAMQAKMEDELEGMRVVYTYLNNLDCGHDQILYYARDLFRCCQLPVPPIRIFRHANTIPSSFASKVDCTRLRRSSGPCPKGQINTAKIMLRSRAFLELIGFSTKKLRFN